MQLLLFRLDSVVPHEIKLGGEEERDDHCGRVGSTKLLRQAKASEPYGLWQLRPLSPMAYGS